MESTSTQAQTVHFSIKLAVEEHARISAIASAENRTAHFIMKEAIRVYLKHKENEQRFIAAAKASRAHYLETGLHITHQELGAWVQSLESDLNTPMPLCHK